MRKVFYVSDWESGFASLRHPIWEAESCDSLNSLGDDCCSRHCVFILVNRWRCRTSPRTCLRFKGNT